MSIVLLIAAASSLAPPQPPSSPLIAASEFPGSVRNGRPGAVVLGLFTDPTGKPMDCDVEGIVDADFGSFACNKLMGMRFLPARGADGKASYGYYRTVINFWLPESGNSDHYPVKLSPNLALSVKPTASLSQVQELRVAARIDLTGKVSDCGAVDAQANANMVAVACKQLRAQWDDTPLEDSQPRSYVRELTVAFVPEGAKP